MNNFVYLYGVLNCFLEATNTEDLDEAAPPDVFRNSSLNRYLST